MFCAILCDLLRFVRLSLKVVPPVCDTAISKVGEVSVSVVAARVSGTTVRANASSGAMGKASNIVGDIDTDF